ncbi:hypothetical protein C4J81_16760 [Deltaproteobacteria bacterium Smac51]|nr:hypothetical protein C4J81_16760 [Deltaproteobacteria bacterium Smac51]
MKFNYAVFDLDMTLIDSITPLMVSANMVAEEFGLPKVTYEAVYQAEISVPNCTFQSLWQDLWGHYDPKWYEAYADHMTDTEYLSMELYPGGRETLEALHGMGIPIGMASNRDYPKKALKAMGVDHLFGTVVGVLDVERSKPAPDMIIKAIELMKAPAEETLYVCDSKGDLIAAAGAGVKAFSVTTGGHSAEELLSLGAWKAGDKLNEILEFFK